MTQKPRRFDLSPDNFLAGIGADLKADELGLYWLICLRIYSKGGPVPYDEESFATILNRTDLRIIKRASSRLQLLGKITVSAGQVMANGCVTPIEEANKRIATASENGRKGGRPSNKNNYITKPDGLSGEKLPSPSQPPPHSEEPSSLRSDGQTDPKPVVPKRERKTKTALPDGCPTETDRETADRYWRSHGRDDLCARLADEAEAFRAHHAARGNRMEDWSAAWRTWYGNALKFNKVQNANGSHQNRKSGATSAHQSFLAGGLLALAGDGGTAQDVSKPVDDPPRLAFAR